MSAGVAKEIAGQREDAIAVIAVLETSEGVEAAYMISDAASDKEKNEIARKLRAIARSLEGEAVRKSCCT